MLPLILPKQANPVLNGPTFSDTWYLFLDILQDYAANAAGIVEYGTRAERQAFDISTLTDGTLWIETDTHLVYEWEASDLDWVYVTGTATGTFAARLTNLTQLDTGLLYQTTDTFALYQWNGAAWTLFNQVYQRTQSQLAALAATLGTSDAGLLVNVTDYAHVLQWTGTAWIWGPGESGSGMFVAFAVAPTGNGWHACDGSSGVAYLNADGTTGTVTLPNTLGSAAYLKAGSSYAASITAATVPTISAPTFTGSALATHQHQEAFSQVGGDIYTFGNPFGVGSSLSVNMASPANPASGSTTTALTSAVSAGTPAGTVSAPTATLPGDPVANFEALLYFRQ